MNTVQFKEHRGVEKEERSSYLSRFWCLDNVGHHTSRPVGYEIARFSNRWFQHSSVEDFNDEPVTQWLKIHVIAPNSLDSWRRTRERVRPMHSGPLCKSERRSSEPQRLPR